MKVGYARVSTKEQNEARQIRAFEGASDPETEYPHPCGCPARDEQYGFDPME